VVPRSHLFRGEIEKETQGTGKKLGRPSPERGMKRKRVTISSAEHPGSGFSAKSRERAIPVREHLSHRGKRLGET